MFSRRIFSLSVCFCLLFLLSSFVSAEAQLLPFPDILTQPEMCKEKAGEIKKVPDSPEKAVEYFLIFLCAGDRKNAEGLLKSADEKFPNNYLIKFNLGNFYLMEGKYDFAVFFLNQAKAVRKTPAVYDSLGTAYLRYGDIESAEKVFDEAAELFRPDRKKNDQMQSDEEQSRAIFYSILLKRGFTKLLLGKTKEAEESFRKYISFDEFSPHAYIGLAEVLGRHGKVKSAIEILERAIAVSDNPKIYLYAGAFLHSHEYFREATRYYMKAAEKLASDHKYIAYFMLSAVERDLGMYVEAREHFEILKKEFPELATAKMPYSVKKRIELVRKFVKKGNLKGAEHELREIIKIDPSARFAKRLLVDTLILKALLFAGDPKRKTEILEEARSIAKDYLDENPSDDTMLFNFALINFWLAETGPRFARTGNLLHAVSALQSAIKIKEKAEYIKLLALSYYLLEKYDLSAEELEKLRKKLGRKFDTNLRLLLASSYIRSGDIKKAERILMRIKDRKNVAFKVLLYDVLKRKKAGGRILRKVRSAILEDKEISPRLLKEADRKKKRKKGRRRINLR